jgi:uncharacterized protein (AIM24 family)
MVSLRRTANCVETWWRVWWNGMYCSQMLGVGEGCVKSGKGKGKVWIVLGSSVQFARPQ